MPLTYEIKSFILAELKHLTFLQMTLYIQLRFSILLVALVVVVVVVVKPFEILMKLGITVQQRSQGIYLKDRNDANSTWNWLWYPCNSYVCQNKPRYSATQNTIVFGGKIVFENSRSHILYIRILT